MAYDDLHLPETDFQIIRRVFELTACFGESEDDAIRS